ncbi:MAG: preprotein translocase subunit SecG [Candidatus Peribacteraceae bacterium]|nr:preprotein translocase subunit SecG [Candidatus Peribacteraceae bacterium]MDD5074919.1 preprotein translocase subunit SecG [Candidatus Peribacteraceae bacterium]
MIIITIILTVVSILLSFAILLQHRAAGLSATFGGIGTAYVQRRGAEKLLYHASIWLAIIFFSITVLLWYV